MCVRTGSYAPPAAAYTSPPETSSSTVPWYTAYYVELLTASFLDVGSLLSRRFADVWAVLAVGVDFQAGLFDFFTWLVFVIVGGLTEERRRVVRVL